MRHPITISATAEPYWYVFDETGRGAPRRMHDTRASAQAEAQRLASDNRGSRFVVLQATDVYVFEAVVHLELGHDIPF